MSGSTDTKALQPVVHRSTKSLAGKNQPKTKPQRLDTTQALLYKAAGAKENDTVVEVYHRVVPLTTTTVQYIADGKVLDGFERAVVRHSGGAEKSQGPAKAADATDGQKIKKRKRPRAAIAGAGTDGTEQTSINQAAHALLDNILKKVERSVFAVGPHVSGAEMRVPGSPEAVAAAIKAALAHIQPAGAPADDAKAGAAGAGFTLYTPNQAALVSVVNEISANPHGVTWEQLKTLLQGTPATLAQRWSDLKHELEFGAVKKSIGDLHQKFDDIIGLLKGQAKATTSAAVGPPAAMVMTPVPPAHAPPAAAPVAAANDWKGAALYRAEAPMSPTKVIASAAAVGRMAAAAGKAVVVASADAGSSLVSAPVAGAVNVQK